MSYILDALKKSDRSRQLNTTHEMSYSHLHSGDERRNRWLKSIAVVLTLLSSVVLAYIIFFNNNNKGIESAPALQTVQSSKTADPKPAVVEPVIPATQDPEQPVASLEPAPARRSTLSDLTRTVTASGTMTASSKSNASPASPDFTGYENYRAVRSKYGLPSLHLDILMYHPELPKRKVYINMSVYQQGDRTKEGAQVMKIGKDGVLLRYSGHDFVLTAN